MVKNEQIAKSKAIQQRTGRTFHFATRLLPERVRRATYVLYAFFRIADEVVDNENRETPARQRAELERLRAEALGEREASDPVLSALAEMRERHGIAEEDVNVFVDAMETDIEKDRYETYDELEAYMDGSAAAVGRMMTAVMDPEEPEKALPYATALGEAFQMTNFLRDVREDVVERDRIYLPGTTLAEHGVTEAQIRRFEMDDRFAAVVQSELARTEGLYKRGVAGIKYLPADCQFAVLLAAVLYAEHHRLIRERDYDVLSATPQLGRLRTLRLFVRTRWRWAWNKDPEAVFRRVSTVTYHGKRRPGAERAERLPAR
ncbi:phytoene/squalene synthase family protein [Halegenticoccus tardaugens]|uniref:phytoene/squalene synthase family protein n=1 Tax=Halegenticoccus tardaugens TaxID=2071624 RepID=UPI00100B9019|nr:phytoene/squalene synthase family protein [Halegenticoccus tardaugens]